MKANFINKSHIEGRLYQHSLELKVTGPNSANPGTEFISGECHVSVLSKSQLMTLVLTLFQFISHMLPQSLQKEKLMQLLTLLKISLTANLAQ